MEPGEYNLTVKAYNLHSEEIGFVKYTHNLTRYYHQVLLISIFHSIIRTIFVQYPVQDWTLDLIHYHPKGNVSKWLDSNGGDQITFF